MPSANSASLRYSFSLQTHIYHDIKWSYGLDEFCCVIMIFGRATSVRQFLFVHHFALETITGVSVVVRDLIAHLSNLDPTLDICSLCYEGIGSPDALIAQMADRYAHVSGLIGINLHIEVDRDLTFALIAWCKGNTIPVFIYVFDYWPHHRDDVYRLKNLGVRLLASTQFIKDSLGRDGVDSILMTHGVILPQNAVDVSPSQIVGSTKLIVSAGRLVPRKRFGDIVRAFCDLNRDNDVELLLRLFPSHVYSSERDDALFDTLVDVARERSALPFIRFQRNPPGFLQFQQYRLYVCASDYEGLSMTPIEAAYSGCPPLMSDIEPHREIAFALFRDEAKNFLFPVGNINALSEMMSDELAHHRRRDILRTNMAHVQATIEARWSQQTAAQRLLYFLKTNGSAVDTAGAMC
jgi:glycosyltransferase involved in cell wall biosynthesis